MKRIVVFVALVFSVFIAGAQNNVAIKTNLLYGVGSMTPNLGVEVRLGKKSTIDIMGGYNPWNRSGSSENNEKLVHWLGQVEYRHWFCSSFNGHFLGAHLLGTKFNIGGKEIPLLLEKGSEEYRYSGSLYGVGISYGYQWMLGKRFNLEFTVGVGYAYGSYEKYECPRCGAKIGDYRKNYFGPTKAGITLVYLIK